MCCRSRAAEAAGARCAESKHWELGGEGALEFADAVIEACNEENDFKFLYPLEMKVAGPRGLIAKEVYGADGVSWTPEAEAKAKMLENDPKYADFATMMVKTHLSLSHDPVRKGVPTGWTLPIRDVLIYSGAKFLCPCAGTISLMPGTAPTRPSDGWMWMWRPVKFPGCSNNQSVNLNGVWIFCQAPFFY